MSVQPTIKSPYATTSTEFYFSEAPPDPVVPKEGSWMLLNTAATSDGSTGHIVLIWTWKRQ